MKILIRECIDMNDLENLVIGLEAAIPGAKIGMANCFELDVSDKRQAEAILALFPGSRTKPSGTEGGTGKPGKEEDQNIRTKKYKNYGVGTEVDDEDGGDQYTFCENSETISKKELFHLIKKGDISQGTKLFSPDGRLVEVHGLVLVVCE